jgi:SAM-dependent methyltransferase
METDMENGLTSPGPTQQMMEMITGYWVTQVVRGAAHYSLADHLEREPMTARAFAETEGLNHLATARFLRTCEALGLVESDGSRFFPTDLLRTLRKDNPTSLRGFALSQAAPGHWLPWGRFVDALQTGERQTFAALGAEIFEYFSATPGEAADFTAAMSSLTANVAAEVARLLDTTGLRRVVDVGGAAGALLFSVLHANPHLQGVVVDLPNVVPSAAAAAQEAGLGERVEVIAGDFFDAVPEADLYLLKYILHDWDDASCVRILRNCRRGLRPGGHVAVVELLLGAAGQSALAPLMDLNMLVMLPGRERTLDEYRGLFADGGFGKVTIIPTNTPMVILTATAA